jgi:hypothetical protein
MTNPLNFGIKPIPIRSWVFAGFMICYISVSLCIFYLWVGPSLDGRSDQHIAADSLTYLGFADSLREHRADPFVIAALATFPNTLWIPVLIALALKNTFIIVVANYVIFFVSLALLKKSYSFSTGTFVALLLLNATTTISLLSVNKEIIDLLVISLFWFASRKGKRGLLLLALSLALLNRFEVFVVMVVFLLVQTKLNFWRNRRTLTLVSLAIVLSVMLPLFLSGALASRFEEASSGGVIVLLDSLEMHFLYCVAVVPKIAENLFGMLINPSAWKMLDNSSDLANSYILLFNNLATAVVVLTLIKKRSLSLRSDLVYFAMIGCILMAISLVIQPRYFYFVYVLLCLQAAEPGAQWISDRFASGSRETANA